MESPHTLVHTPGRPARAGRRGPLRGRVADADGAGELVLGRYRLLERLGAGGFGEVWRAHDEMLHREVAVKRVTLAAQDDAGRATREALAAARLSHPAIVALYEACSLGDSFYLISELVHGDTLARLIAQDELTDEEIVEIGLALAGALAHAHSRGVIHRDIKPHNVLVPEDAGDASGAAKLTDFGGASLTGEDALTRTGDVLGTLAYMAPEQCEGADVDERADLYSLALVLYEALTGVNPVRGVTPAATARRIGSRLTPLHRHRRDLPRPLTRALDVALAPRAQDRGTLEDLRAALEESAGEGLDGAPARPPRGVSGARADLAPAGAYPPPRPAPGPVAARGQLAAPESVSAPESVAAPHAAPVAMPSAGVSAAGEHAQQPVAGGRRERLLAPARAVWLGVGAALVVWQAWAGRPGAGLLVAAALLPLLAMPRALGVASLTAALAPALGVLGLAGAFPALAGQRRRWIERAALAALAYWWLILAEPLLGRELWLGVRSGTPPRADWEGSLSSAASHVVWPAVGLAVLLGAALWALAAAVLPWVVRGRSAALDIVAATMWSAAIVSCEPLLDHGVPIGAVHGAPRGAVLGGILGGALAVAGRALRGPV